MQVTYLNSSRIIHLNATVALSEKQIVDGILLDPYCCHGREEIEEFVSELVDTAEEAYYASRAKISQSNTQV